MRYFVSALLLVLAVTGCGGGGSSSSGVAPATGGFTLLVGDGPLDGVAEVNIVITSVVLIGDTEQRELTPSSQDPINLLDLRNLTESVVSDDVPVGTYNKIRLNISSLEIVETNGATESAQLPANGKIDLNPQGPFSIVAGEDLVVEIDMDLDRSVQVVQTGNSKYKFRPVVFIEVIDQSDNLRLTRLFGSVEDGEDGGVFLCDVESVNECNRLEFVESSLLLDGLGVALSEAQLVRGESAWVFGHFAVNGDGEEVVRVVALAAGDEDALAQIDGSAGGNIAADTFELFEEDEQTPVTVALVPDAKLLDGMGQPLSVDVVAGDEVEAWGQVALIEAAEQGEFPAFLVQVRPDDDEDSVAGELVSVTGDELILSTENDGQACAIFTGDTEIQLVSNSTDGAETDVVSLTDLAERINDGIEIEAFGELANGCIAAELIVAEVD